MAEAEATIEAPEADAPEAEPPAQPDTEGAGSASADAKKAAGKPAKEKKGKSKSKGKEKAVPEADGDGPTVAAHPRAARSVATAKGWGGLGGFLLGGYLSLPTHTLAAAGLRALVAGVLCYVAAWAGALFFWRRMVMVEIKAREQQLIAASQAARARQQAPASASPARGPQSARARS